MSKVSVIVPAYKAERYLAACLESLAKQRMQDLEVIVVVDASPDSSADIVEQFVQRYPERFRLLLLKDNVGVSQARNLGMIQAKGDYIGFVDADDIVAPDMYRKLYHCAATEQAEVVSCQRLQFEEHCDSAKLIPTDQDFQNVFVTSHLFNRGWLEENGLRFYPRMIFEDQPFLYLARYLATKVARCDYHGYFYRLHDESLCRDPLKARFNIIEKQLTLSQFVADAQARGLLQSNAKSVLACLANSALSALYYPIDRTDLLSFWHCMAYLDDKYRLTEQSGLVSNSYCISRFLRYRHSDWQILLLARWVKARQGLPARLPTLRSAAATNPVEEVS